MSAEQILLVNPRRRRRKKNARRSRRRVSRIRRRRLKNPFAAVNPRRRRHRSHGIRRRRRNPRAIGRSLSVRGIVSQLIPAATGAVGAVGLDIALSYIPVPDAYKTGWIGTGVKIAGAIGLGMLAGRFVGRERGKLFTAGALTVIAYQVVRGLASQALGDKVKGLSGVADFTDLQLSSNIAGDGMGAYMRPALAGPGLGAYMNPAGLLQGMDGGSSGGDSGYYGY